jgi:hypothetical protein
MEAILTHSKVSCIFEVLMSRHDTQMQLKRYNDITSDMIEDEEEGFDEDLDIDLGSAC